MTYGYEEESGAEGEEVKAPDLSSMDRNELLALRCMFEGLTVEESIRVLGVQRSLAQYIRGKAVRKLGTTCVIMAVRLLCAAGWNNEDEDHGDEEESEEARESIQ